MLQKKYNEWLICSNNYNMNYPTVYILIGIQSVPVGIDVSFSDCLDLLIQSLEKD